MSVLEHFGGFYAIQKINFIYLLLLYAVVYDGVIATDWHDDKSMLKLHHKSPKKYYTCT